MEQQKNIWVVIPAYNEGEVIKTVITEVLAVTPNVVVVDDCSKDITADISRAAGATVLRHVINLGQGAALQTGMDYALENGADIIVHFDADGQLLSSDIARMAEPIEKERAEIALGSRFLGETNAPLLRRMFLKGAILFTWFFSGIKLSDSHNGFRALSRVVAQKMRIRENRMAHASEILHEIARLKLSFEEVPVTIRYTDYSQAKGESSLRRATHVVYRLVRRTLFI